jgi:hypothetical protein
MTSWKLVPLEPTLDMAKAAIDLDPKSDLDAKYRAMVQAAPNPPPLQGMPPTQDRRPYDEETYPGYLDGNRDWAGYNDEAVTWLADNHAQIRASFQLIEQMAGALNFILAFYEPQNYLDTNAWTQAEAGGRRALKAAKDAGYFGGNASQAAPECTPHEP